MTDVLKAGVLAYYTTLQNRHVSVRVIRVEPDHNVIVRTTNDDHSAYPKGEVWSCHAKWLSAHRSKVRTGRILLPSFTSIEVTE